MIETLRKPVVAYEPKFDRDAYLRAKPESRERLNAYTKRQLETHLGERFNVVLSTTRYEIKDEQVFGENTDEPFMHMLQRGRNYRRENGNPIDFAREDAELVGFSKIDSLAKKDAKVGETKILISAKGDVDNGSIYNHNFYDIFTLKEDDGERYVEARRYSSALTLEETARKLKNVGMIDADFTQSAEYFLSHPIDVSFDKFSTADNLHDYLHKDHEFITEKEFEEVKRMTAFLAVSYINSLLQEPIEEMDQLLHFNAYLNAGDMALDIIRGKNKKNVYQNLFLQPELQTKAAIYALGREPVRVVTTGCGASGGFNVSGINQTIDSPFSVSEFGAKKQEWFSCPKCSYKADGPVGNKCPGCGLTKEKFVEEGGAEC